MKKCISFLGAVTAALFLCSVAHGDTGGDVAVVVGAVASTQTYALNANDANMNRIAVQILASSATFANETFTGGSVSTGSITIVSFTALSTATATGKITVSSNTQTVGNCVSGGGPGLGSFNVCNPGQWSTDSVSSSQTAANLATAINGTGVILATSAAGGVVYTTATYAGSAWNAFQLSVSSYGALTLTTFVSSIPYQSAYSSMSGAGFGQLTGGQDNQSVTVNGTQFIANRDFFPMTSTAQTATNLATAINASSMTTGVGAGVGGSVVFATSTAIGTNTTYALISSSNGAASLSSPVTIVGSQGSTTLIGGSNASWTIGSASITIATQNFPLGLAVSLSTGGAVRPSGLTTGTTYFAVPAAPGVLALASTYANATAVPPVTIPITSSQTVVGANTYTLTASTWAVGGAAWLVWQGSNDGQNWTSILKDKDTTAMSALNYTGTGNTTQFFDFGTFDYKWLGLNIRPPSTGALQVSGFVNGKK